MSYRTGDDDGEVATASPPDHTPRARPSVNLHISSGSLETVEAAAITLLKERVMFATDGFVVVGSPLEGFRAGPSWTEDQPLGVVSDGTLSDVVPALAATRIPFLTDSFYAATRLHVAMKDLRFVENKIQAMILSRWPRAPMGLLLRRSPAGLAQPLEGLRLVDPSATFDAFAEAFGARLVDDERVDGVWCSPREAYARHAEGHYYLDLQCWTPISYLTVPSNRLDGLTDEQIVILRHVGATVAEDVWHLREQHHLDDLYRLKRTGIQVSFPTVSQRRQLNEIGRTLLLRDIDITFRPIAPELQRFLADTTLPAKTAAAVRVFFATDCSVKRRSRFNRDMAELLEKPATATRDATYGEALVTVPEHRDCKESEPVPPDLVFDPMRHSVVIDCQVLDRNEFQRKLEERASPDLLYVHGWSISPDNALVETADFAAAAAFAGTPIAFVWAHETEQRGFAARLAREALVPVVSAVLRRGGKRFVRPFLKTGRLLHLVPASYTRADDVWGRVLTKMLDALSVLGSIEQAHNVVAHSMGNRITLDALINRSFNARSLSFIAPDVPTDTFANRIRLISPPAPIMSVYFSQNDIALMISEVVHKGGRAGQGGAGIEDSPDIDAVDASELEADAVGHSYHRYNKVSAFDLSEALNSATPAPERTYALFQRGRLWTLNSDPVER